MLLCLLPTHLGFRSNRKLDSPSQFGKTQRTNLSPRTVLVTPSLTLSEAIHCQSTKPPTPKLALLTRTSPGHTQTLLAGPLLIPDSGIDQSPSLVHRFLVPPVCPKRSSFATYFPQLQVQQDPILPPLAVPGTWVFDNGQTPVQLIGLASIPPPLRLTKSIVRIRGRCESEVKNPCVVQLL